MMELLQVLICIWETLLPVVAAGRVLDKRRMALPVKIIWCICMSMNVVLLVYQRSLVMYSRWYLFVSCFFMCLLLIWCYKVRFSGIMLGVWLFYETVYVMDLFLSVILSFVYGTGSIITELQNEVTIWRLCIYGISRACVTVVMYAVFYKKMYSDINTQDMKLLWIIPILMHVSLMQCDMVFGGESYIEIGQRNLYLFIILYVILFSAVIIYWMNKKGNYERLLLEEKTHLLEKDCDRILSWNQERDILIHDIKNHYIALEQLLKANETERASDYVEAIIHSFQNDRFEIQSGNIVVDAILGDRIETAKKEQILIKVITDDLSGSFVTDQDWCVILSNMVDNAIEACRDILEKQIVIRIEKKVYGVLLELRNSSNKPIEMRNGTILSSKSDKKGHGLGMISIRETVKKYSGTLNYEYTDGMVRVVIVLYPQMRQHDVNKEK